MDSKLLGQISVIIPSFNEATRFSRVVDECLKLSDIEEIILVDDGSTDDTEAKAKKIGDKRFVYLRHKANKGKGAALQTGLKKAKNEIVLFLDADLMNITSEKIKKIYLPVLKGEIDLARGSFKLSRGRVTELAVKPMMKILFPDLYFDQPISGQVCAKKEFLETIDFESKWGVDIGILLDAISSGQRIVEVDIGRLEHKARSLEEKAEMAEQVLEMMIKKAGLIQHKYKLVIFTLDNTLIKKDSFREVLQKLKFDKKLLDLNDRTSKGSSEFSQFITKAAALFKDKDPEQITQACQNIIFSKYAKEVINSLKKRRYQVAISSSNFSPLVLPLAKELGIELVDCVEIEEKKGRFTGQLTADAKKRWCRTDLEESFRNSFLRILKKAKVSASETILVVNSPKCVSLFDKVGLSIAFRPTETLLAEKADKTIVILPEILAIIE